MHLLSQVVSSLLGIAYFCWGEKVRIISTQIYITYSILKFDFLCQRPMARHFAWGMM